MRLCVLASGSTGNCIYVGSGDTHILIDAGISGKATSAGLDQIGVDLDKITGLFITHEHIDHVRSLGILSRKTELTTYINDCTKDAVYNTNLNCKNVNWAEFTTGDTLIHDRLKLTTYAVSHDASDPVCYFITDGQYKVGIVTDMGVANPALIDPLRECQAIVMEFNHDPDLLQSSARPIYTKRRIAGERGHLSNHQAQAFLNTCAGPELEAVFLSHLSQECNRESLAMHHAREAINDKHDNIAIHMTYPKKPSALWGEKPEYAYTK